MNDDLYWRALILLYVRHNPGLTSEEIIRAINELLKEVE